MLRVLPQTSGVSNLLSCPPHRFTSFLLLSVRQSRHTTAGHTFRSSIASASFAAKKQATCAVAKAKEGEKRIVFGPSPALMVVRVQYVASMAQWPTSGEEVNVCPRRCITHRSDSQRSVDGM